MIVPHWENRHRNRSCNTLQRKAAASKSPDKEMWVDRRSNYSCCVNVARKYESLTSNFRFGNARCVLASSMRLCESDEESVGFVTNAQRG